MAQTLALHSESEFDHRAPEGYPVSCPTLDLCATCDAVGKNIYIHRPPSQVVSKIHQLGPPGTKAPEALAVTWNAHGQFLAVGWSDGIVRLMGLENSKAAHHIDVCSGSGARISHIGWVCCNITSQTANVLSGDAKDGLQELQRLNDTSTADLPREITFLEIETALPKISPLPGSSAGTGEDAIVFTLRTGIEFLFQTPKPEEYDQVNVMLVGMTDGTLHLSLYDSFVIGSLPGIRSTSGSNLQLVRLASHPQISTQALLMSGGEKRPDELYLQPVDLPFISSNPVNLSLLASKLTTLQKLLRYLRQTQLHMQFEWKNTRELPGRFLRSVEGGLEDMISGPKDVVAAMYHTVVTGHAYAPVREWLVDSLAERGHKRWDKAVTTGLESLRSLVHENFLPALDRCFIILSRLRGLAQFHEAREDIGFSASQITKVMDVISCLKIVGHKMLLVVMDELEHFKSFSAWLRFQIDRLQSTNDEELTEKEATMDIGRVLTYIEHYLVESPLRIYFDEIKQEDRDADLHSVQQGVGIVDVLTTQLGKYEDGQAHMKALPHVEFLMDCATQWANDIFESIARTKKRSVRFGQLVKFATGRKIDCFDVRMCQNKEGASVYAVLASQDESNKVNIFHVDMSLVNGISTNKPAESFSVDLDDRKLVDAKFLGDGRLVVLCTDPNNAPTIIMVPIQPGSVGYTPLSDECTPQGKPISCESWQKFQLPAEHPMRTVKMDVHDRVDVRGEIPARICLLSSNRTKWTTFTIPEAAF